MGKTIKLEVKIMKKYGIFALSILYYPIYIVGEFHNYLTYRVGNKQFSFRGQSLIYLEDCLGIINEKPRQLGASEYNEKIELIKLRKTINNKVMADPNIPQKQKELVIDINKKFENTPLYAGTRTSKKKSVIVLNNLEQVKNSWKHVTLTYISDDEWEVSKYVPELYSFGKRYLDKKKHALDILYAKRVIDGKEAEYTVVEKVCSEKEVIQLIKHIKSVYSN